MTWLANFMDSAEESERVDRLSARNKPDRVPSESGTAPTPYGRMRTHVRTPVRCACAPVANYKTMAPLVTLITGLTIARTIKHTQVHTHKHKHTHTRLCFSTGRAQEHQAASQRALNSKSQRVCLPIKLLGWRLASPIPAPRTAASRLAACS